MNIKWNVMVIISKLFSEEKNRVSIFLIFHYEKYITQADQNI